VDDSRGAEGDTVNEDEEDERREDSALRDTGPDCKPTRKGLLVHDTDTTIAKESADPTPSTSANADQVETPQQNIVVNFVKGFGEI
jgi:hypothetical protein